MRLSEPIQPLEGRQTPVRVFVFLLSIISGDRWLTETGVPSLPTEMPDRMICLEPINATFDRKVLNVSVPIKIGRSVAVPNQRLPGATRLAS